MFSPPRIHHGKAVYINSSTLNQIEINKLANKLESANSNEEYSLLNEERQNEKKNTSNQKNVMNSIPKEQILLIKSHIPDQSLNVDLKFNIATSNQNQKQ